MATEEGIITALNSNAMAIVKTTKTGACAACSARGACNVSESSTEMEVEARNSVGGRVGDRIILSIDTSLLLKAAFLIYLFPVLLMLAGAIIGLKLGQLFDSNESVFSAITGFLFLFIAILFVKTKGNKLSERDEYRPEIIRIVRRKSRETIAGQPG